MKRNNVVAIICYIVLFVILFALVVPLIIFPMHYAKYSVFGDIETVQSWIDESAENFQDSYDDFLGEIEPNAAICGTFVFNKAKYKISAYQFKEESDREKYYQTRTASNPDENTSSYLKANYFGSQFIAYDGNNLYCLSGGDYNKFSVLLEDINRYFDESLTQ